MEYDNDDIYGETNIERQNSLSLEDRYLMEVKKYKLLTPEEEIKLSQEISKTKGDIYDVTVELMKSDLLNGEIESGPYLKDLQHIDQIKALRSTIKNILVELEQLLQKENEGKEDSKDYIAIRREIKVLQASDLLDEKRKSEIDKKLKYARFNEKRNLLNSIINVLKESETLTKEREDKLNELEKKVSDASEKFTELISVFVKSNLRLSIAIAVKHYDGRLSLLDLIQEGNMGLAIAAEKYNFKMEYKFSTYAAWWIKQKIFRAIADQGRNIRLPVYVQESSMKVFKARRWLTRQLGRTPTLEEIAEDAGVSVEDVKKTFEQTKDTISLSTPVLDKHNNQGELELGDQIAGTENLHNFVERKDADIKLSGQVKKILVKKGNKEGSFTMSENENRKIIILMLRFGLDPERYGFNCEELSNKYNIKFNDGEKTLEEIGKAFNLSRERIRQIENSVLRKLQIGVNLNDFSDKENRVSDKSNQIEQNPKSKEGKRKSWYELAKRYVENGGDLNGVIPKKVEGRFFRSYISKLRVRYKKGQVSEEMIRKYEEIGMKPDSKKRRGPRSKYEEPER